jgi:hypothetical protein
MPAPEPFRLSADAIDTSVAFRGRAGFNGTTPPASLGTYTLSNVTASRTGDTDTMNVAALADVVGTLIADLRLQGIVL